MKKNKYTRKKLDSPLLFYSREEPFKALSDRIFDNWFWENEVYG